MAESEIILEPWDVWIKRATHTAEARLEKLQILSWNETIRRRRWNWLRHISQLDASRWAKILLHWKPIEHTATTRCGTYRRQARPRKRWTDDLLEYLTCKGYDRNTVLKQMPSDKKVWEQLGVEYITRKFSTPGDTDTLDCNTGAPD